MLLGSRKVLNPGSHTERSHGGMEKLAKEISGKLDIECHWVIRPKTLCPTIESNFLTVKDKANCS
jgi:hypothetical protein